MSGAATLEHAYRYVAPSQCVVEDARADLSFATSGGVDEHPSFFTGWVPEPVPHAAALLCVARVARTSFFDHVSARMLDPVVTTHVDRLRFEAFSSCCSAYVRYDVDAAVLEGEVHRPGATNIDVNAPLRSALAKIGARSSLHLTVGPQEVAVLTERGSVVERKVPLPVRWVKGFGEVGVAQAALQPALELAGATAQRFLTKLPPRSTDTLHVIPGAREPRWGKLAGRGAFPVGSSDRLKVLEPLARHATGLRAFAGAGGASAWILETPKARLHLILSPHASRGFSGEGGVLEPLATERLGEQADRILDDLAWQSTLNPAALGLSDRGALEVLASRGRAGYDLARESFFHRDLPYDLERVESLHPRLRDARRLVEQGAVELTGSGEAAVRGSGAVHRVRLHDDPPACSCRWWARTGGGRGPCKHVLAAQLVAEDA